MRRATDGADLSLASAPAFVWDLVPGQVSLRNLKLHLGYVNLGGDDLFLANLAAECQLLPSVFPGAFAFQVDLEKSTGGGAITGISGAYHGAVTLGAIVRGFLGDSATVPNALNDVLFSDFGVAVERNGGAASYRIDGHAEAAFDLCERKVSAGLTVEFRSNAGTKTASLSGAIVVGDETFSLSLQLGGPASVLRATWNPGPNPLNFADVARLVGWDTMPPVPEGLDLGLKIAQFDYDFSAASMAFSASSTHFGRLAYATALRAKTKQRVHLVFLALPFDVDLSRLPLVGASVGTDPLKVDPLCVLAVSDDLYAEDLQTLRLPDGLVVPKANAKPGDAPQEGPAVAKGMTLAANVAWRGDSASLFVNASGASATAPTGSSPTPASGAPAPDSPAPSISDAPSGPKWVKVDRSFGPVHLDRVGVQFQSPDLRFLLDGSLGMGGLKLALIGLSVGSSIKQFAPTFDLAGLGLSVQSGDVEISGSFLHNRVAGPPAYDEYAGSAVIRMKSFTLGAIGAYANVGGSPSLFIYAVLDMPIGGPSFFFVTGLAAGFGYNRGLRMPAIDQVASFPLVQEAVGGARASDLATELTKLRDYVPPSVGDQFFCVGIRFTSFKLVDSFALIAVRLGNHVEVDLLGLSTLVVPTPEGGGQPLAVVQLAIQATFLPDDGFLGVVAQLTPASFLLSKDCHLSGGGEGSLSRRRHSPRLPGSAASRRTPTLPVFPPAAGKFRAPNGRKG